MKADFKFNFNDQVKVRLKQKGIDILRQQHDELDRRISSNGGKGIGPFTIRIDDDGYASFQLWDLMRRFGEHMVIGFDPPFYLDVIMCGGNLSKRGRGRVKNFEVAR